MNRVILVLGYVLIGLLSALAVHCQPQQSFVLKGLQSQTVPVTLNKMTNLVFPASILSGVKVSREVAAQKVKGVDNVLELKAVKRNFTPTNLSVFGMDGRLYSFDLRYADSPYTLNFQVINTLAAGNAVPPSEEHPIQLTGLPVDESTLGSDADSLSKAPGFLHKAVSVERMKMSLRGIYLKDDLLWLLVKLRNRSLISYRPEYLRLNIIDRKRAKRTAIQQIGIEPIYGRLPKEVKGSASIALGFPRFTIAANKKMSLELAEHNGERLLQLEIKHRTVLRARDFLKGQKQTDQSEK